MNTSLPLYEIVNRDNWKVIERSDNNHVILVMQKGKVITEDTLNQFPPQSIFLDGALDAPPFINNQSLHYNLDHHKGVVRPFTLATCEQALLLIIKGLSLGDGVWHVFGNEPDLDTLIAMWVLINYDRILSAPLSVQQRIIRLVRVEGLIDSHGLRFFSFLGYDESDLESEQQRIQYLIDREQSLRSKGLWDQIDFVHYTMDRLSKLDNLLFTQDKSKDKSFKVLEEIELGDDHLIVVCASTESIYEVERQLWQRFGTKLTLIIQQQSLIQYTLKLADDFYQVNLHDLYEALNKIDSVVNEENFWGGSDNIGGSPRATGTKLQLSVISQVATVLFKL